MFGINKLKGQVREVTKRNTFLLEQMAKMSELLALQSARIKAQDDALSSMLRAQSNLHDRILELERCASYWGPKHG